MFIIEFCNKKTRSAKVIF